VRTPHLFAGALLGAALVLGGNAEATQINLAGAVQNAGPATAPAGARLADALIAAQPRADAYLPGTLFLRESARQEQVRLKAGLLHDLHALSKHRKADYQHVAAALIEWLEPRPVTGRVVAASTDMRLLQVQPLRNPELEAGDALDIPVRPETVTVSGAVRSVCTLPHAPLKSARQYAKECQREAAADPEYLYVIQADGNVQKLGVALWNRADPQAVSPGGTVYIPIRASVMDEIDPKFNAEFAAFIATQPVSP